MKKTFTLLSFLCFVMTINAQVIFEQNFESGMAPMKVVDRAGRTPHPNVANFPNAWNVANPATGNGTNIAVSNSWFQPAGAADGWMMTPKMFIEDARTSLQWEAKAQDTQFPDGYEVRVSRTGDDPDDFSDIIFSVNRENPTWTNRTASLADFVGDSIHIAYRNNSNDMFLLYVDNISVRLVKENSVALNQVSTTRFHRINEPVLITGTVENKGSNAITFLEITWTDGEDTHTDELDNINIPVGGTYVFEHSVAAVLTSASALLIDVSIANPNGAADGEVEDGLRSLLLTGVSSVPTKRVLVEEGTGTWCGWCPRGFVAMEHMDANYPETFIGIMVHNGDPMVVSAHDSNSGFNGFPGAHVDRRLRNLSVSTNDFVAYHDAGTREVVPFEVEVMAVYNDADRSVSIEATATSYSLMEDMDLRFSIIMVEDTVKGTGSTWNQANFYSSTAANLPLVGYGFNWQQEPNPIPAARMHYNEISRALLGGYNGQAGVLPVDWEDGQSFTQTFSYTVPAISNPNNMRAVAILIDGDNGHILNAAKGSLIMSTSVQHVNNELDVLIYPNPASGMVNLDIELENAANVEVAVFNTLGQRVAHRSLGVLNGQMVVPFETPNFAPGVYSFVIHVGNQMTTRQVIFK